MTSIPSTRTGDLPTFEVELDMDEIRALMKTLGIGIDNLLKKSKRIAPHTSAWAEVNGDLQQLLAVQTQLIDLVVDDVVDA